MLLIRNNGHTNFISDNKTKATFPYPNRLLHHVPHPVDLCVYALVQ